MSIITAYLFTFLERQADSLVAIAALHSQVLFAEIPQEVVYLLLTAKKSAKTHPGYTPAENG
jgi:hypothetical protein